VESVGVSAKERIRRRRSGWARGEGSEDAKEGTPELYEVTISSALVRDCLDIGLAGML
jgi:hypothetical protein